MKITDAEHKVTNHKYIWEWLQTDVSITITKNLNQMSTLVFIGDICLMDKDGYHEPDDVWTELSIKLLDHDIVCEAITPPQSNIQLPLMDVSVVNP